MKTRVEVVTELADRKYHSFMGGDMWPSSGVDLKFVAWMLDANYEALATEVSDEFEAMLRTRNAPKAA